MHGEVTEVVRLTPSLVRIVLGGEGLDGFEPTPFTDQYVNALFIPEGAPYSAPFDLEAAGGRPGASPGRPALHDPVVEPRPQTGRDRLRCSRRYRVRGTVGEQRRGRRPPPVRRTDRCLCAERDCRLAPHGGRRECSACDRRLVGAGALRRSRDRRRSSSMDRSTNCPSTVRATSRCDGSTATPTSVTSAHLLAAVGGD